MVLYTPNAKIRHYWRAPSGPAAERAGLKLDLNLDRRVLEPGPSHSLFGRRDEPDDESHRMLQCAKAPEVGTGKEEVGRDGVGAHHPSVTVFKTMRPNRNGAGAVFLENALVDVDGAHGHHLNHHFDPHPLVSPGAGATCLDVAPSGGLGVC